MFDYKEFVSQKKSMLTAPAGFGKTHTIAECLKHTQESETQLILTHTHAGIASIKEKIKKQKIPSSKYSVETITGFAQKYVLAFYTGNDIPDQENNREYYPFIIEKATELLKYNSIKKVVSATYNGLFVDEYQDCTLNQHELIVVLSSLFNTRIFGDHMQGIFGFNETLVDLDDSSTFSEFTKYEQETPWRWIKGENPHLGENLKSIRKKLEENQTLSLDLYNSIETYTYAEVDLYNPKKNYNRKVRGLLDEKSILIIHPVSSSINPRIKIIQLFNNRLSLVESIDDNDFYSMSQCADEITKENIVLQLRDLSYNLFNKSGLDNWFNNKGFKKKTKGEERRKVEPIINMISVLENRISFSIISNILREINNLEKVRCYRRELINSFCKALEEADFNGVTVLEAMTNKRNSIRRMGRKVIGKCIGTTLLTKGLEFETVVILNAHRFECPKHLYVALTRASKKLIVFTENEKLTLN